MGRRTTFTAKRSQQCREYLAEMRELNTRYFALVAEIKNKSPMGPTGLAKRLGVNPGMLQAWKRANPDLKALMAELKTLRLFLTRIHRS